MTDNGELLSLFSTTLNNNDFMAIYEGDETLMPRVLTENKELAKGFYNKWMEHMRQ